MLKASEVLDLKHNLYHNKRYTQKRENTYFLSLVFLILKPINNFFITEIYLTKVIQSHSVFHGDYSYTNLVLYLSFATVQTKDKYLQNLK